MDLKETELLGGDEGRHWYYDGKARALQRCLTDRSPAQILDVGAGSGFFSRMLLRHTAARTAVCVDRGYPNEWSDLESGKPIAFRRQGRVGAADLVLLMDVLEHVDDDVGLLREYAEQAAPRTRFIVSVPAFSWLWSGHDVFLEHRRRYTLQQLLRVVRDAGLMPVTGFYFFAAPFAAVALQRVWQRVRPASSPKSDLRRHHPVTNAILAGICRLESTIARHNRMFGLTAFAVAEKA